MINPKKIAQVQFLVDLLKKNPNFVLIKFNATSHQTLENLRKELKKNQALLKVIKNTLFEKAVNKLAIDNRLFYQFKKQYLPLKNASALIAMPKEWSNVLASFYKLMKNEKTLAFDSGVLDGQSYNRVLLEKIAQLPGKNDLLAKITVLIKNPAVKLTYALQYNLRQLVYILRQKSNKN